MLCANSRMTAAALQATEKRIKDETKPELLRDVGLSLFGKKKRKRIAGVLVPQLLLTDPFDDNSKRGHPY